MAKLCESCVRPMGRVVDGDRSGWYCPACSSRFVDGERAEPDEPEGTIGEPGGEVRELTLERRRPALEVERVPDDEVGVLRLPPLRPDWREAVDRVVGATAEALEGGAEFDEALEAGRAAGEATG